MCKFVPKIQGVGDAFARGLCMEYWRRCNVANRREAPGICAGCEESSCEFKFRNYVKTGKEQIICVKYEQVTLGTLDPAATKEPLFHLLARPLHNLCF
jgi:hypothetical protein